MQTGSQEMYNIVALIRDGRVMAAEQTLQQLIHQSPEVAAQLLLVTKLFMSIDMKLEEQRIENSLREYGSAPAYAYRVALNHLEKRAEKRVISQRLQVFIDHCSSLNATPAMIIGRLERFLMSAGSATMSNNCHSGDSYSSITTPMADHTPWFFRMQRLKIARLTQLAVGCTETDLPCAS